MTSAANDPLSRSVAVRHTPFTAIESPGDSAPASAVSTCTRPWASPLTTPLPATSPVNTSPLLEAGDHEHVVLDPLGLDRQGARRGGDLPHADPLDRGLGGAAAQHQRRDEHAYLVDLAGLEERARQVRAALEQQ